MKLRPPPEEDARPEPILPLIDIVFFLLVFFMLIGRMDATSPFDVNPPVSGIGADMPGGGATLTVAVDGRVALDGDAMEAEAALNALSIQFRRDPGLRIRIQADAEAALRHVLPMVGALEEAGVRDLVLVVTPDGG